MKMAGCMFDTLLINHHVKTRKCNLFISLLWFGYMRIRVEVIGPLHNTLSYQPRYW